MPELPAGGSNVTKSQGPVLWSQFAADNKFNLYLVIHLAFARHQAIPRHDLIIKTDYERQSSREANGWYPRPRSTIWLAVGP